MPNDPMTQPERIPTSQSERPLTDEVVAQVADKVYALLLQDLILERERHAPPSRMRSGFGSFDSRGGW